MNRKRFTTIILSILLTILPVISVTMMYHITLCQTLSQMDSGCFGEQNALYKVTGCTEKELAEKVDAVNGRVALYAEQKVDEVTVEAIYFNKYYINFPMKSGHFFRKQDLTTGKRSAVIGKSLEKRAYQRNDSTYIDIDGQEYNVIGVIGYEEDTIIDNYIYISMLEAKDLVDTKIYTLDIWGEKSDASDQFYELLSKDGIEVKELSSMQTYGTTILPQILYGRWFICLFLCNLICIVIVSMQWIGLQRQEIGIRRLVGGNMVNIACYIAARYFKYVGISIVISFAFCVTNFSGYLHSLTVGYVIAIPVIAVLLGINIARVAGYPLTEAVKE